MPPVAPASTAPGRLLYVDRLRIIGTGVILGYHSARPFNDFELWHIKYDEVSSGFTWPVAIGAQFALPLFWILSGIVTGTALATRRPARFTGRRLHRLLVPVVGVGWLLLCPPQVFVEATTDQHYLAPPFAGSYLAFLGAYPRSGVYGRGGFFPVEGLHLWYLTYLALFTFASLPVLAWLRGASGRRAVDRLGADATRWWLLPALGLPLLASELLLPSTLPVLGWYQGGWRLGTYWLVLLLGVVLGTDERLRTEITRRRRTWLVLALVTLVPLLAWAPDILQLRQGTSMFALQWGLRTVNGWFCLLALLGYGARHLASPGWLPAASAELVLPFYVVHQTVIVLVAYALRGSGLPVLAAFATVVAVTLATSLAAALVVQRFRVLRFLFGLGPRPALSR